MGLSFTHNFPLIHTVQKISKAWNVMNIYTFYIYTSWSQLNSSYHNIYLSIFTSHLDATKMEEEVWSAVWKKPTTARKVMLSQTGFWLSMLHCAAECTLFMLTIGLYWILWNIGRDTKCSVLRSLRNSFQWMRVDHCIHLKILSSLQSWWWLFKFIIKLDLRRDGGQC